MSRLSAEEIVARLRAVPEWRVESGELERTYSFRDFIGSVAFINALAELAEAAGHHPDIDIRYNRVRLKLVTHDEGGLTEKDFELAVRIDRLA
jgi:4a-hydroxytetrahydrobiopterin dehydratase